MNKDQGENIKVFWVDAFSDELFKGNPAAVCPLQNFLEDSLMQKIAFEHNLSETAFIVKAENNKSNEHDYEIRWFTPDGEVDLCGHATLSASFVIFNYFSSNLLTKNQIRFQSRSGILTVNIDPQTGELVMDFPRVEIGNPILDLSIVDNIVSIRPLKIYESEMDLLLIYPSEDILTEVELIGTGLRNLPFRGLSLTAQSSSNEYEIYSRCFYPDLGVPEDPVTGSAHCLIAPYWSKVLNKKVLRAKQGKKREGYLACEVLSNRVLLKGQCKLYMEGKLMIFN